MTIGYVIFRWLTYKITANSNENKEFSTILLFCSFLYWGGRPGAADIMHTEKLLFSWNPRVSLSLFTIQGHSQWEQVWQNLPWMKPKIEVQFFSTVPHRLQWRTLFFKKMAPYGPMLFVTYSTSSKTHRALVLCKHPVIRNYWSPVCKSLPYY